ncbi:SAF domain-containing protein [Pontiellaceae bacterium B12219]|nr:SAF domain-containing protein [Pontiellaceae bacterium B12219]
MKTKLFAILIASIAVIASLMIYVEAGKIKDEGYSLFGDAEKIRVIVANDDLPSHTTLTTNNMAIKSVLKSNMGSFVLTPEDFEKVNNKQLKYPVKKYEPLLSLYLESMIENIYSPSIQRIYKHDALGIQITIPDNWKLIPLQDDSVYEEGGFSSTNELYLGYFDPESGDIKGTFLLLIFDENNPEQALEDLEDSVSHKKINWNNQTCYFSSEEQEQHITADVYTVLKQGLQVNFMVGYKQSYADEITQIINEIIF